MALNGHLSVSSVADICRRMSAMIFGAPLVVVAMMISTLSSAAFAAEVSSSAMTYQTWKSSRIDDARAALERINLESTERYIDRSPGEKQAVVKAGFDLSSASRITGYARGLRGNSRLEQAKLNLEIAQDLSVDDYLVVYLSQFKSRAVLLEVARRLTPEDIVDLLLSQQRMSRVDQVAENSLNSAPRTPPRPL